MALSINIRAIHITMKKFMKEFKEFALKGNVFDMAVGIIIGAAFGKIVSSLVSDIFMPLLSLVMGNLNLADAKIVLKAAELAADGSVTTAEVALTYGAFLNNVIDFLAIALVIFIMIKAINKMRHKEEAKPEKKEEKPSEEVLLLREIRDSLKKK